MKELFVILLFIVLLTGVRHTLIYITPIAIVGTATIAALYLIGFLGLETLYKSLCYKDKKRRHLALFFGAFFVVAAHFSLETLLTGR